MKFLEVVKQLQEDKLNDGYLILIKNGIFFVGIGKDAIILHDLLGLKVICLKENVCKAGIPVKSIEKYINLLTINDISFVLYNYTKKINDKGQYYETIFRFSGKSVFEKRKTLKLCTECDKRKENDNHILERLKENGKQN